MMMNWALLPVGKSFERHYHEDLEEVFIMFRGKVKIKVYDDEAKIGPGDAVVIPMRSVHEMKNIGTEDVHYIAIGLSGEGRGKTVVV
jgi:mannose-6-phosphate isomerase-like protein (cupin superfamily)